MRDYLKQCREKIGLTQLEIAKKLDISESYYCLIEKGERQKKLEIDIVSKLSEILSVSIKWIIEQEKLISWWTVQKIGTRTISNT